MRGPRGAQRGPEGLRGAQELGDGLNDSWKARGRFSNLAGELLGEIIAKVIVNFHPQ